MQEANARENIEEKLMIMTGISHALDLSVDLPKTLRDMRTVIHLFAKFSVLKRFIFNNFHGVSINWGPVVVLLHAKISLFLRAIPIAHRVISSKNYKTMHSDLLGTFATRCCLKHIQSASMRSRYGILAC